MDTPLVASALCAGCDRITQLLPILLPYPPTMGNKSAFRDFSVLRRPPHFRLETATNGNN